MFDAHPQMAIPGESVFIASMASKERRYRRDGAFAVDRFVADLVVHPWFVHWGLPEGTVRQTLQASRPGSFSDAIRTVFALYASLRGKQRYGDKTPVYVLCAPLLARLFPEARFIHLIRDGRDVALSLQELPWGPGDLRRAVLYWKRHVTRGRKAGVWLGPDRYCEVRYEALLEDPEGTLRDLCAFIELEFDPAMLRYPVHADELASGFSSEERQIHRHLHRSPTKGLRDWRSQMSREEVAVVEALIGDLLEELGYERATQPRFGLWLGARMTELGEQADRVQHRLGEIRGALAGSWLRARNS